jgi:Tfp pilus assembly protein PilX
MAVRTDHPDPSSEHGGITIVVVLMLLVLLTISTLALSKNSVRSAIASGTLREAYQAENVADAGLEYAVYWTSPDPNSPAQRPAPGDTIAQQLQATRNYLQLQGALGIPYPVNAGTPASTSPTTTPMTFTVGTSGTVTETFDLTLMLMGDYTPPLTTKQLGSSTTAFNATSLNLWSVVADGNLAFANGQTFTHRREVWFTLPQTQNQ